jgi:hypothetical protein
MKAEILDIAKKLYHNHLTIETGTNLLLGLFDVSTRTFKVGDKVKWRGMELIVVELGIGEILIATSKNVDDENYNDWWVGVQYVC